LTTVAVLTAMAREAKPLAAALGLRPVAVDGGRAWGGPDTVVAVVGVGPARAASGAARVLSAARPGRVLVVGVAGALSADLDVGEVLAPDLVVDVSSGRSWRPHRQPGRTGAHRGGTLATVAAFGDPASPDAVAVDMETAAVAQLCDQLDVPWDVLRVISDRPGAVSPAVAGLVKEDGRVDATALAWLLLRRPAHVRTLLGLRAQLQTALAALTAAVVADIAASRLRTGTAHNGEASDTSS
jgi:hypothetical protein